MPIFSSKKNLITVILFYFLDMQTMNLTVNKKIQAIKVLCTARKAIPNTACVWIFEN